jgi:hypothetical protein
LEFKAHQIPLTDDFGGQGIFLSQLVDKDSNRNHLFCICFCGLSTRWQILKGDMDSSTAPAHSHLFPRQVYQDLLHRLAGDAEEMFAAFDAPVSLVQFRKPCPRGSVKSGHLGSLQNRPL